MRLTVINVINILALYIKNFGDLWLNSNSMRQARSLDQAMIIINKL